MNKKENVTAQLANVRITRARSKALGASSNPNVERQVLQENPKRSASNECVSNGQCKRRAVLKDVTNALQKKSYMNCFNAANPKECKLIGKGRLRKNAKEVSATGESILLDPLKTDEEKFEAQKEDPPPLLLKGNESVAQSSCGSIEFGVSKLMIRQIPKHTPSGSHSEKDIDKLGITDIDSKKKDPQLCSVYVSEIYSHLRVTELERRPSHDFMETVQRDITQSMRAILIDWLVEVTEEYKLVPDTLYLTVNLIDRFLSENYIEKQRLQLVGVSCMLIASKYEEICAPRVEEFCFITDNTYSKEEVLGMESQVLNFLHFQLSIPTTKTFLRRFIHVAQAINKVPCLELEFLANYLTELTLTEYSFIKFLPSLTAASALFLARWTLDQSSDPWNSTLEHYTSYTATELKAAVLELQDLQLNINGCILNAIRDKYRQPKFKCVAELSANKPVQSIF